MRWPEVVAYHLKPFQVFWENVKYNTILYLKFTLEPEGIYFRLSPNLKKPLGQGTSNSNCPIKKDHLYRVTMWFFTVFHSNSWFRNAAWDTIISHPVSHGRSTVGYYSISRVTRGHHALKQYGVRELLFVISYRRFIDLTKDFQDVCYLSMLKYFKEETSKTQVYIRN
jgi:hypothetical protein